MTGLIFTTADRLEELAFLTGNDIEISDTFAELKVGRVVYRAYHAETRAMILEAREPVTA